MNKAKIFKHQLLKWSKKNTRKYSWRNSDDPWKILLLEIIAQQTQLDRANIYYEKFINNVEKHSFMLSDLVKCFTDILWERLATQDNNLIEINIKTKKDVDDCKKCKDHIKKSISFLEEMIKLINNF